MRKETLPPTEKTDRQHFWPIIKTETQNAMFANTYLQKELEALRLFHSQDD